jgi:hypothetical protein
MKKILITLVSIVFLGTIAFVGLRIYTKSFSPIDKVVYKDGDFEVEVRYCRPFKKDREVFGALVPYGEVWRTGANEATEIHFSQDVLFGGARVPKGIYSLWTVPGEKIWKVILNSEVGQWGVEFNGRANKSDENDVVEIDVSAIKSKEVFEQFTISFEEMGDEVHLVLMWDQTIVVIPIER